MIFDIFSTHYLGFPDDYIAKLQQFNLKNDQESAPFFSFTIELNTIDDLRKIMGLFPGLLIKKGDDDELPTIQIADVY